MTGLPIGFIMWPIAILYYSPVILVPFAFYSALKKQVELIQYIVLSILLFVSTLVFFYGVIEVNNYYCRGTEDIPDYYMGCLFGLPNWDVFVPAIVAPVIFYSVYLLLYLFIFAYFRNKK